MLWCVPLVLTGCVKHVVVVAGKKVPFPPPEVTSPLAGIASFGLKEPWLRYQNASIDPSMQSVRGVRTSVLAKPGIIGLAPPTLGSHFQEDFMP